MEINWSTLYEIKSESYRQLRFPTQCQHEIYFGITPHGERCLLFYLKDSESGSRILFDKSLVNINLNLIILEKRHCLVLNLLNSSFKDIFDDLIISFFNHIQLIQSESDAVIEFIQCYNKWIEFFRTSLSRLGEEDIKGLIGELMMFEYLLKNSKKPVNDIIASWKGPFGKAHDFEFDEILIEVKSIDKSKSSLNISSEYQLDYLNSQELFLAVYSLEKIFNDGITISSLIARIISQLRSFQGVNMEKFWSVVNKSGINISNLAEYDNYIYSISTERFFKVNLDGFPRIARSFLNFSITDVKYKLSLSDMEQYKVSQIL